MNVVNLDDQGIDHLSKLKDTLQELSFYEPSVNNKLLTTLSEMKLKDLNLTDMKKTSFSNQFKKLFRGNKIKIPPKILLYDPIANAKQQDTNFKNKIIKGKKNYNSIINPVKQYEGTVLANNIVELELNSKETFQDIDLQNIGLYCKSLRWISLSFPNTYPKTVCSLINCPELIIVQLTVTKPVIDPDSDDSDSDSDSDNNVHEVNRSLRVPNNNNNNRNNNNNNNNDNENNNNNNGNNDNNNDNDDNNDDDDNNNNSLRIHRNDDIDENVLLYRHRSHKPIEIPPTKFKASSPECQSLITLSQHGKKIRFLQLCGPIGLTDYTLSHITNLVSLNTFWIKECNDFSFDGICKFSEAKWKVNFLYKKK